MRVSAAGLASLVDGSIVGDPKVEVESYAIDSRLLEPGACFVALRGRRDGHDFVGDAFRRGARVALVARHVDHPPGTALVVVDDPLGALARVARHARARWRDVAVVGITGSAGKTATKDLTAAALGASRRVHASPGSYNNEAGLPLTLLGAPPGTEVVVAEMGARFPGNIAELCAIAAPTIGIVTHVGLAHAEHLGGREGIARTKGELVEALPADGVAVLNADDDTTPGLAARTSARVLTVGHHVGADVAVRDLAVGEDLRPAFVLESPWGRARVRLGLCGAHQALNAAMAAGAALVLDVPLEVVASGLGRARPARHRMEVRSSPAGVVVLDDAYNASPSSVQAALDSLARVPARGRRVAVLGDMLELGEHEHAAHAVVGRLAAASGVDLVVAVGPASAATAAEAAGAGVAVVCAADADEARELVAAEVRPGDAVLVKGSRAMGLEVVAEALARGEHRR